MSAFPADRVPQYEAGRIAWLRLARSAQVGPVTVIELMRRYPSAPACLEALPALAAKGGGKSRVRIAAIEAVRQEYEAGQAAGARLLMLGAPDYPHNLSLLEAPPPVLWCLGEPGVAKPETVGIVGARNASALALRFTEALARDLGARGYAVASGLARGIDAAAHRGALETGTVAVLAGGVDRLWPPQNADLYEAIIARGAILSERPMGYEGRARDFPRRNRIVSGLSRGVVVAEGAERSGSLITARYAGEQGRDVMAVPGSPMDARAGGCNALIRDGATLIRGIDDVVETMSHLSGQPALLERDQDAWDAPMPDEGEAMRRQIVDLMGVSPVPIDELVRRSGASTGFVSLVLLELDLAGRLRREPGSAVALNVM